MKTATYPDEIMKEYKALVREKHTGRLPIRQQKRLTELREMIQTLSRQDAGAQAAAQQVKGVNRSLEALKSKVQARIAKRKSERELGQTA